MELFLKTVSALNDETRIKILRFIDENGSMCVCDLQESFGMIQSRLSRHLKILKDAGFLRVERQGTWAYYSVRTPMDRFRLQAGSRRENCRCQSQGSGAGFSRC